MNVNRAWTTLIGSTFACAALAQGGLQIYHPALDVKDQGITLRGWGSGTVSETDEMYYTQGGHSIRISTRNYFQGGIIAFAKPVSLATQFGDKNNLLRLTYDIAAATVQGGRPGGARGGGAGFPGGPGGGGGRLGGAGFPGGGQGGAGFPGGPGGGRQGGGGQGGGGGTGFPGGGGQRGGPSGFPGGPGGQGGQGFPGRGAAGGADAPPKLKDLRVIITTTDGKKSEAYIPVDTALSAEEEGWKQIAVPLKSISGFDRTNKVVQSIGISGDATTTLYLGELSVVEDSTPIRGSLLNVHGNLNLALGDEFTFDASGTGGATPLKYSWNFDTVHQPGAVDAEGQHVVRKFRKEGTYTVTLTVSDLYDLKTPYQTTFNVVVNP